MEISSWEDKCSVGFCVTHFHIWTLQSVLPLFCIFYPCCQCADRSSNSPCSVGGTVGQSGPATQTPTEEDGVMSRRQSPQCQSSCCSLRDTICLPVRQITDRLQKLAGGAYTVCVLFIFSAFWAGMFINVLLYTNIMSTCIFSLSSSLLILSSFFLRFCDFFFPPLSCSLRAIFF